MSQGQYTENPYQAQYEQPQQPAQGYGQANPYAQESYELDQYNGAYNQQPRPVLSQSEFLDQVKSLREQIRTLTSDIDHVGQLHQRTLGSADSQAKDQLEQFVSQTQIKNTAIKDNIKRLEKDYVNTTDSTRNTKDTQLKSLKTYFKSELDKYQSIERDYQQKYREQIARQYRIVNPDASEEEVREATQADWGDEGVFQTAIKTNRTGHATSVLGNVRARHNELQRIEHTLGELAILHQELAAVVEQQDNVVAGVEDNAHHTLDNLEEGNKKVKSATDHARRARKLKWWCALIVFLIILAIALGVGLGICLTGNTCSKSKSNN